MNCYAGDPALSSCLERTLTSYIIKHPLLQGLILANADSSCSLKSKQELGKQFSPLSDSTTNCWAIGYHQACQDLSGPGKLSDNTVLEYFDKKEF